MSDYDWCVCGHHRDDHYHSSMGTGGGRQNDGSCSNRFCLCSEFALTRRRGQQGSEAGCYS